MLDKFEDGKRYRFSKEKFIEGCKSKMDLVLEIDEITSFWVDRIDQKEVGVRDYASGSIEGFKVAPPWCEEIIEGDDR